MAMVQKRGFLFVCNKTRREGGEREKTQVAGLDSPFFLFCVCVKEEEKEEKKEPLQPQQVVSPLKWGGERNKEEVGNHCHPLLPRRATKNTPRNLRFQEKPERKMHFRFSIFKDLN